MDLKDPRSSKKAAEEFIKREKKLDILSLHIFLCLHDVGTLSELRCEFRLRIVDRVMLPVR